MDFKIRDFKTADTDQVIGLWSDCGLLVPWNDPRKDITRKMKVDPDLFLVAEDGEGITGTVMGGYEGHRGWINYLAVVPRVRFMGLGRLLMETVEQRLRIKGAPKINLQIRSSNKGVIRFYQSIGFKDDDVLSMGKRLEEHQE